MSLFISAFARLLGFAGAAVVVSDVPANAILETTTLAALTETTTGAYLTET
jgi:hypothetical protein